MYRWLNLCNKTCDTVILYKPFARFTYLEGTFLRYTYIDYSVFDGQVLIYCNDSVLTNLNADGLEWQA